MRRYPNSFLLWVHRKTQHAQHRMVDLEHELMHMRVELRDVSEHFQKLLDRNQPQWERGETMQKMHVFCRDATFQLRKYRQRLANLDATVYAEEEGAKRVAEIFDTKQPLPPECETLCQPTKESKNV